MRVRLTGVSLMIGALGLGILGPLGACAYAHSTQPFNSVRNDSSDKVAWCEGTRFIAPFGDTVSVGPGEPREVGGSRCTVMKLHGSGYFGCLAVGEANNEVLPVSTHDPTVDYFDCEGDTR